MSFTDNFAVTRSTEAWSRRANGKYKRALAGALAYSDRGMAAFEAITNQMQNPRFVGAVAGTPGTLPTFTGEFNGSGLTRTIVLATDDDGVPMIGYRYAGTPSASGAIIIQAVFPNAVAATSGQTWTFSAEAWLVGNSGTKPSTVQIHLQGYASNASTATESTTVAVDTSVRDIAKVTRALNNASTAFVQGQLRVGVTSGVATDFTLWVKAPNLIQKAFPYRAPILPATTGAFTKNADIVTTLAGAGPSPFPGWTEESLSTGFSFAGSILFDDINLGVERTHWEISDGSNNNAIRLVTTAGGLLSLIVRTGGSQVAVATCATPMGGAGRQVWAGSVSPAGLILSQNIGILEGAQAAAFSMPSGLNQPARVGSSTLAAYLNAYVEQIYFAGLQDTAGLTNWVLRN